MAKHSLTSKSLVATTFEKTKSSVFTWAGSDGRGDGPICMNSPLQCLKIPLTLHLRSLDHKTDAIL
jgi:hypothetical protein